MIFFFFSAFEALLVLTKIKKLKLKNLFCFFYNDVLIYIDVGTNKCLNTDRILKY